MVKKVKKHNVINIIVEELQKLPIKVEKQKTDLMRAFVDALQGLPNKAVEDFYDNVCEKRSLYEVEE